MDVTAASSPSTVVSAVPCPPRRFRNRPTTSRPRLPLAPTPDDSSPTASTAPTVSTITLRPWQRAAFDLFNAGATPDPIDGSIRHDFLAVATPGAGKTTFALACARAALAEESRPLIVVAPTSHLKTQWSLAAHRLGLELDPNWSPGDGLARDVHGLVTTYQQVATGAAASKLAGLCAEGFVILDEVHHAGHDKAWGDSIRKAFVHAHRRLSLSGTPFRSDAAQIPFVRYDATGEGDLAYADFTYGYADALARRRCRAPGVLPTRRRRDGVDDRSG